MKYLLNNLSFFNYPDVPQNIQKRTDKFVWPLQGFSKKIMRKNVDCNLSPIIVKYLLDEVHEEEGVLVDGVRVVRAGVCHMHVRHVLHRHCELANVPSGPVHNWGAFDVCVCGPARSSMNSVNFRQLSFTRVNTVS